MSVRLATLLAVVCATSAASAQRTTATRSLVATPPSSVVLGRPVTLSVQGARKGARYRYVATMFSTGNGAKAIGPRCALQQSLGSGTTVTWHPTSGTYRLTAYGPLGQAETDTLSLTYVVQPRTVMLASGQSQTQGGFTLMLRTDDLGPGHTYEWSMLVRFKPVPNGNTYGPPRPPLSWTTQTTSSMTAHPTPVPAIHSITAAVSVHRGNACDIVAAGAMDRTL